MASYTTLPPPVYSEILPIVDLSPPPPPPPPQFQFKSIPNPNPPPSANPSPIYLSPPPLPPSPLSTSYYSPPPPPDLSSPLTPPMASPPLPSYDTPPPLYVPPPPLPPPALPPPPPPAAAPPISPPPPPSSPPPVPVPPPTAVSTPCPPSPPPPVPVPPPTAISGPPPQPVPPPPPVPVPPPTAISGPPPQPVPPPPPVPVTPTIVPPSPRILPKPPLPSSTPPPPTPPIHSLPSQPRAPSTASPLPLSVPSPSLLGRPNSSNFTSNGRIGLKDSSSRNNGIANGATASVAALLGFMMLSFVGVAVWLVRKRKRLPASSGFVAMSQPGGLSAMSVSTYPRFPSARDRSGSYGFACSPSDSSLGNSRSWFTYEDLSMFTNGFSAQNILGEGGFGPVYKGRLPHGRLVAVKQLKVGGSQGEREFRAEVEIISRVHHRHLVSLVGYCISEHQKLLVYDYVPNNTLHYHLHGKGMPVMEWATRVKVAAGAARGIAYLHEDCHPRIIHRDIKSSNILLDNNFEAQVSDFGLARLAMDACTHVTTRVMGTFGYLAPEYASTGKLTSKSDVYSFGVVLLELITGRKPVDVSQPLGDESLVEWARPLLSHALEKGEIGELPDPRLEERYNRKEIFCMIEAAASCVRHSAAMRPRMGQVVRALANLVDSDLTNGVRPGKSEEFNSGPNSEEIEMFQRTRFSSQDYNGNFS